MGKLELSGEQLKTEIERMLEFIKTNVMPEEKVVIGVSGGLDSDVVARVAEKAIGAERIKLFVVIQEDMEERHLENARNLAKDLKILLVEIQLEKFPKEFMKAMEVADSEENFRSEGLLDPARAKCALRTVIFSSYQDRGYIVLGTSNRTEKELGFFLPFGDNIAHLKPIVHLYKSQIKQIAKEIGSREEVILQPASAGFWKGQEDIEDISYWLYNKGPIKKEINFTQDDHLMVKKIKDKISTEKIDLALLGISEGLDFEEISRLSGIESQLVEWLQNIVNESKLFKNRELGVHIKV